MTPVIETRRLLAQADLLLLLARLFSRPGADRSVFEVPPEVCRELLKAAGMEEVSPGAAALIEGLREARTLDLETWKSEHTRLFEGAGTCPMNETIFVRRDKGAILADIAGFYRGFGWEASVAGEKLDYLVTELEFTAVLLITTARAAGKEDAVGVDITGGALQKFLADHLGEWLPGFCERLLASTPLAVYRNAAAALAWVAQSVFKDQSVSPSMTPSVPESSEESRYFECGPS